MQYLDYNEHILHGTPDRPIACYYVDEKHPRYRMPMHWHIECEIIRVRRGLLHLYVDDARITAREGDLIFLGKGAVHGGEPEGCIYECIVFDAALLGSEPCARALSPLLRASMLVQCKQIDGGGRLSELAAHLFSDALDPTDAHMLLAVGALYTLYGHLALLSETNALRSDPLARRKAEQLKPALEYIESHYAGPITLGELARLTGLSPKYFCRYFRAVVHRSPIDYLNFYRIECASALLSSSDLTVAEVAYQCGFNDSSFFIKQFRRYKGATPKKYRDELRSSTLPAPKCEADTDPASLPHIFERPE